MRLLTVSAVIAATGIIIAGSSHALSIAAPWLSEESCFISVAQSSGAASAQGAQACRSRFDKESDPVQLSDYYRGLIEGRASFSGSLLDARVYNGGNYTITKLRVAITDPSTSEDEEPKMHYYDINTNIGPYTTESISEFTFRQYETVAWHIVNAWGFPSDQ